MSETRANLIRPEKSQAGRAGKESETYDRTCGKPKSNRKEKERRAKNETREFGCPRGRLFCKHRNSVVALRNNRKRSRRPLASIRFRSPRQLIIDAPMIDLRAARSANSSILARSPKITYWPGRANVPTEPNRTQHNTNRADFQQVNERLYKYAIQRRHRSVSWRCRCDSSGGSNTH